MICMMVMVTTKTDQMTTPAIASPFPTLVFISFLSAFEAKTKARMVQINPPKTRDKIPNTRVNVDICKNCV